MKTSIPRSGFVLTMCLALLAAAVAYALPQKITYQGLLSEDGDLVTGTKSVTFNIYGASTGGTSLWEEVQDVDFENGAFGVILGSVTPIPASVFEGSRRWLAVTIEGGSEMLPRPEIVSVGYAFYAENAGDAATLDGRESWEFAGSVHSHDSRYYTQSTLSTTDGDPPNEGSNLVHWDILKGVPTGFADGIDNAAAGPTDHGALTGLADDDHPQYARKTVLKTSDASAPNEGSNQVHWDNLTGMPEDFADGIDNTAEGGASDHGELGGLADDDHPQYAQEVLLQTSDGTAPNTGTNQVHWDNLAGVPSGFVDGADDITTSASLIVSGSMDPQRITGTAVTESDDRLLTAAQKDSLTSGGITSLHYHEEIGDVSSVSTGPGLTGGGLSGAVTISHAADASALPNAHHYAPVLASIRIDQYMNRDLGIDDVTAVTIDCPAAGFLYVAFSGTQYSYVTTVTPPPVLVPRRYLAKYGFGLDDDSAFEFSVTSSAYDTTAYELGEGNSYLPANAVSASTVLAVTAGEHDVYLLTQTLALDPDADNIFKGISLTAIYFPLGEVITLPPGASGEGETSIDEPGQ